MIQKMLSHALKIPNKILICRELNKEQLSLLELFKILRTFMHQIQLNFEFHVLENFKISWEFVRTS
jgi:hypothetical protein